MCTFLIFFNICYHDAAQELATNPDNLLLFTSLVVTTVFVAQVESWLLGTVLFVEANLFVIIN